MVLCRKFRPERLQFHSQCSAAATAAALPTTCAQEARITAGVTAVTDVISGGFSCFAASYPQYCESKCTAPDDSCQMMVEPSYSINQGPTQLLGHLFVGSQTDAVDAEVISRLGITHVLNVSASCPQSQHVSAANFMRIPVNDGYVDKLLPHFKRAFHFLESVRLTNGRCLVHCLAGISRSPTLTIAYIMQHLRMSQDDAYRYVKARRPSISPNFNFLGQLMEFERQLQQEHPTDTADSDLSESTDTCSEAKRQRTLLRRDLSPLPATSAIAPVPGQSPTSALSRLTFAVHQQQHHHNQQRRRQRPRSVALTGQGEAAVAAPTTTATTVSLPPSSSVSASASLGGSQEIPCS